MFSIYNSPWSFNWAKKNKTMVAQICVAGKQQHSFWQRRLARWKHILSQKDNSLLHTDRDWGRSMSSPNTKHRIQSAKSHWTKKTFSHVKLSNDAAAVDAFYVYGRSFKEFFEVSYRHDRGFKECCERGFEEFFVGKTWKVTFSATFTLFHSV